MVMTIINVTIMMIKGNDTGRDCKMLLLLMISVTMIYWAPANYKN